MALKLCRFVKGLKRTGEARWPIAHGSSGASAQPRHTTLRLDGIWPAHRLSPMARPTDRMTTWALP